MRSRFWLGDDVQFPESFAGTIKERVVNTPIVKKRLLPSNAGLLMAMHCAQEYANLAQILPELYEKFGESNE